MKNFITSIIYSKSIINSLLFILLVSIPFGSSFFAFSISFMTLYPGLIVLFLLTFFGFFHLKSITHPLEKYTILFFCFWLIYVVVQFIFLENKSNAKIDIRSVFMFTLFTFNIIWIKSFLGNQIIRCNINFVSKVLFFGLFVFSLFEICTGIHFIGEFTNKLNAYSLASVIYCPVFLFDNPNNFTTFFLLIGGLIILTERTLKEQPYLIVIVCICCFFISLLTSARTAQYLLILIGLFYLVYYLWSFYISTIEINKKAVVIGFVFTLCIHFVFVQKYYGPIWQTQESVDEHNLHSDKKKIFIPSKNINSPILLSEITKINADTLKANYSSKSIRLSLIYNGLYFTKESNLLGIGPGQFRERHLSKEMTYYTGSNLGPHNGFIEILSQYGIIILIGFIFIFFWIFFICLKRFKNQKFEVSVIIILMLVYAALSILPSGFLIFEINWLFLASLVISATSLKEKNV